MTKAHAPPLWIPPAAAAGGLVLGALAATWRSDWRAPRAAVDEIAARGPCIFMFWHSRMLPLVVSHRNRGYQVLVSQHHDGELIARILSRFGFGVARGSSTRGGEHGLRGLLASLESGISVGITPDGPRGPAEIVKPGLVYLASRSGVPVIPTASAASSQRRLRSWDGFRVPHLFARVVVRMGAPLLVPQGVADGQAEHWRAVLEQSLRDVSDDADRAVGAAS